MWVLFMVLLQGATGVSTSSTYFTDQEHCEAALHQMQDVIKHTPSVTYLLHCQEAGGTTSTSKE